MVREPLVDRLLLRDPDAAPCPLGVLLVFDAVAQGSRQMTA
jgi:hypothetical protein